MALAAAVTAASSGASGKAEVRGVVADSAKATWFLTQVTDAPGKDDVGECPLARRGDTIFAVTVVLPEGYKPKDGVGLEVETVALVDKSSGTSGLVITSVTMQPHTVEKLLFYGLPDNEPADSEVRPGDRLLPVNGTIVCNRPTSASRTGTGADRALHPRRYLCATPPRKRRVRLRTRFAVPRARCERT
jgi:hypothetical protein